MKGVLDDVLVLDLSRLLPGPYCSMILADHGARVICIEDRRFEKESLAVLRNINRNKEHMTLNLKSAEGKEIFYALAKRADVILEGFRPGVVDRLGVGYESVRKLNPSVIYCAVTGFGQNGPLKDHVGHDLNFLGHSGVLALIGPKNGPPVIPGVQFADMVGGLNSAIGIMLALYARGKTGRGQYIDISMTDALTAMLPFAAGWHWAHGRPPARGDALLSHRYACYNVYRTSDGKYLTLGALEPRFWEVVCRYFGVPDYIPLQFDEPHRQEITEFFKNAFSKNTREGWLDIFRDIEACLGTVLEVDEALESDNTLKRHMVVDMQTSDGRTVTVLGNPIKLTEMPATYRRLPPDFGADTHRILKELGYPHQAIKKLTADGVI